MESKKEMSKLTDNLMKQIDEHTMITEKKLEKLEQHVNDQGKILNNESINEVKRMQFRIRDFQQVYYISENKFKPNFENIDIRDAINEILEMTQGDLKSRNIEVTLNVAPEVPDQISADLMKVKQVVMNIFMQNVMNQLRGFIQINVSYKEPQNEMPFIAIEVVNSKFEVKQKDAQRLSKLTQENQFAKILESKVDINYKIAKILSNALNWKIDFNAFRSNGKQTIMIPIKKDTSAKIPAPTQ